jgi:predicted amidohydrolase
LCEKAHGTFYNSYALMGAEGLLGLQRKIHASQDEYFHFRMGRSLDVFDLGFCRVAVAICFDASFSEVWRVLALKGAELLLLPHAGRSGWGDEVPQEKQRQDLRQSLAGLPGRYGVYAEDNALFAAYANQVGYNGHSTHSGGAYILGPKGELLAKSEPILEDNWISAELDPRALEEARNARYSLLRNRRPEVYSELTRMI